MYIDDILIYSRKKKEDLQHLKMLLRRLKEEKLYVTQSKCSFMEEETEFLVIFVGKNGIKVNP